MNYIPAVKMWCVASYGGLDIATLARTRKESIKVYNSAECIDEPNGFQSRAKKGEAVCIRVVVKVVDDE